jgi:hypothetical protein
LVTIPELDLGHAGGGAWALHFMIGTGTSKALQRHLLRGIGPTALLLSVWIGPALAQQPYPPPGATQRNPACIRLETQLATIDRGNYDPARAEQIRRIEDAAHRQQAELDRLTAQGRRMGCEGRGFFSLFGGQPAQCAPLNNQIQQARADLDRVLADLQRAQGNSGDREAQRRSILVALGQSDCGPQYRQFANQGGGFFDRLFGNPSGTIINPTPETATGNTFRTICVRTCDGYYFPISYSTVPGKFAEDDKVCHAMCPAAEVSLFTYRNPGEDVAQAISTTGKTYSELPNAFAYRKALNPACGCKAAGQTWADALKYLDDQTVVGGDIVVDEERAKQLSQPRTDAKGKPIRSNGHVPKNATPVPANAGATQAPTAAESTEPGKRKVRIVGPAFYQQR